LAAAPLSSFPPRYEAKHPLGKGGGGEVWAVRDRVTGRMLALKALSNEAGALERTALVREAMALSGLEGLGVPQVLAFGALPGGRPYLVRELVEGESLDEVLERGEIGAFVSALAGASEKLTVLHRAGLLHGDVKPANVIVDRAGRATLVDLGLAAPWREGTRAAGLTPRYAAPELFAGEPLTVRAEVYSLGATLAEALEKLGARLPHEEREALGKIAARATAKEPSARYPSVDEFASALRHASNLAGAVTAHDMAWPVVGIEPVAQALGETVARLAPGEALAIVGPEGAGRTTLARRLSWTLGIEGRTVARLDAARADAKVVAQDDHDAALLELDALDALNDREMKSAIVIADDVSLLSEGERARILAASERGARVVGVGHPDEVGKLTRGAVRDFDVPVLAPRIASELVLRIMPSLPSALVDHLVARTDARPGRLRAALKQLAGRPVISKEDVDEALGTQSAWISVPRPRRERIEELERLLDTGRIGESERLLTELGEGEDGEERVRLAVAAGRAALGRGDPARAAERLDAMEREAKAGRLARAWYVARARTHLRSGEYTQAAAAAEAAEGGDDAVDADAMAAHGVALAFAGDEAHGKELLSRSLACARKLAHRRLEAVALGAMAILHQRAGRSAEARQAYEESLAAAEKARDVATVALTRLNLAGLARAEGDLAAALAHLEAAVDMGRRAGSLIAVQGALLHLANLDLYLGRYARARGSIESLERDHAELSAIHRATLLGLSAELAARSGDLAAAIAGYERSAQAWEALGRPIDAAESRLEGLLTHSRVAGVNPAELGRGLEAVRAALGESGFAEHEALAQIVTGAIALLSTDEAGARAALDRAHDQAAQSDRREWQWLALEARARLSTAQGSKALARRDVEGALAILEETAAKLPRDLREVFWNDPRRRALQEAHGAAPSKPAARAAQPAAITGRTTTLMGQPLPAEDRLARIFEITRELATERDLPRLLARVTDHAILLLGAERGFIVLADAEGKLSTRTVRDRTGDDPHAQFSHSVAERVITSGEPVVVERAREDERLAHAVSVHQLMIQSIACVPIRAAGIEQPGEAWSGPRTIGALYLETRLRPGVRFSDELPTLAAFADQAAIAIESARLIEENRARAEELAEANQELSIARDKLSELLGRRTEQLAVTRRNLKQARAELRSHFGYAGLVGTSAAMRKLYALLERIKDTDVPVLVTGESGTGKEVVAKAIHAAGARAKKPFLGVNCGAIPANLLESELFGHVRGAFTGADRDRKGLFREAEGGTLLLDEIGDIPIKMQPGLLRVLQERSVRPVGGVQEEPVDVRIVAATNRDLSQMVAEGTFREDLFYRLHVVEMKIPPLRERTEDIPPLIDHFLSLFAARYRRERKAVDKSALRRLLAYEWPGNVRQLEHVLLNAWLMGDEKELMSDDFELPDAPSTRLPPRSAIPSEAPRSTRNVAQSEAEFKDSERERILNALTACNWNRVQAARMIGLPRRTFYRRLKEFGIL